MYKTFLVSFLCSLMTCVVSEVAAQTPGEGLYDIGSPTLVDIWVDPSNGNDDHSGASRAQALRTVTAAWGMIPQGENLSTTGYRIMLASGVYTEDMIPNYWESRYGTSDHPIILQSADGRGAARFAGDINAFDVRYFYLIDFDIIPIPAGDVLHFERSDHVLIRNMYLDGAGEGTRAAQETVKFNQSHYVYIENSSISGATDNPIDFVSVQYGHAIGNNVSNGEDWCMYVKGGSAYFLVEGNTFFNCGTGGFTTGQGTGFEFMTSPWIHYEAYDVKFVNNVIHDTEGAGIGVNGGYNILMAFNTMYRVGSRSHGIEAVFGARGCDGDTVTCTANRDLGGWGPVSIGGDGEPIPNKNVFIYDNILYNPTGFRSDSQQFAIYGPRTPAAGTNIPSPAFTDTNLQIKGNIIWNGPGVISLGVEENDQGCQSGNPTCTAAQLAADNQINQIEPQLIDPASGDFRPQSGGNIEVLSATALSNFGGGDREAMPLAPEGNLTNSVTTDRGGSARSGTTAPGAYVSANSAITPTAPTSPGTPGESTDTTGPTLRIKKATAQRKGKKVTVNVTASIEDNSNIATTAVSYATPKNVAIGSGQLNRVRTSNDYKAKTTLRHVAKSLKKLRVTIEAQDGMGNTSTKTKSVTIN